MKFFFKSLFLLPILFIQIEARATFSFDNQKAEVNEREFHRYVLPQLKSIQKEFFILFQDFHPSYRNMIKGNNVIQLALDDLERYQEKCDEKSEDLKSPGDSKITDYCFSLFKNLKTSWLKVGEFINKVSLSIPPDKIPSKKNKNLNNKKYSLHVSRDIEMENRLEKLFKNQIRIQNKISQFHILKGSSFKFPTLDAIKVQVEQFSRSYQFFFLSALEEDIREVYSSVFRYFLEPLQKHVISSKESNYLLKNIEPLNIAWNTFHMRISKTDIQTSAATKKLATQIHRRWVSILKIILRK